METKTESTQEQTSVSEELIRCSPIFPSDEAKLAYYTQMYRIWIPNEPSFTTLGTGRLITLRRKLKQHLLFLQELSEREWGKGLIEMQTTCSAFMMREGASTKRRMEVSSEIGKQMAFLVYMAENRVLLKSQYALLNIHHTNVCYLINKCSEKDSEAV